MAILSTIKKGYLLIKTATGYVKLLPRTLATLVSMADGSTVESQITALKGSVSELNSNIIEISKLSKVKWDNSRQLNTKYILENDGYLMTRASFTTVTGYFVLSVCNESGIEIFRQQVNSSEANGRAFDSCLIPVKQGWSFKVTGTNIIAPFSTKITNISS